MSCSARLERDVDAFLIVPQFVGDEGEGVQVGRLGGAIPDHPVNCLTSLCNLETEGGVGTRQLHRPIEQHQRFGVRIPGGGGAARPEEPVGGIVGLLGGVVVGGDEGRELVRPVGHLHHRTQPCRRACVVLPAIPAQHRLIGDIAEHGVLEGVFGGVGDSRRLPTENQFA